MSGGRKFLVGLLAVLLFFVITVGSFLASLSGVLTDRTHFKQALARDEVYQGLARAILEQPFQNVGNPTEAQAAETPQVNQASLQKLINQYFTPVWYKGAVETAVDGVYNWLEGKTLAPDFVIPITNDKAGFQQFIIETVTSQYNALPPCTQAPSTVTEINPLDATCKLSSFNDGDIANYIRGNAGQEQFNELFNNTTLNSKELFGQVDPQTTKNLQSSYRLLKVMPWIFMVTTALLIGLMFLSIYNRRHSFKFVGLAILVPTVFVLIGTLLGWLSKKYIVDTAAPNSSQGSDAMAQVLREALSGMFAQVNQQTLIYGLGLLGLASVSLGLHWWLNRNLGLSPANTVNTKPTSQVKK